MLGPETFHSTLYMGRSIHPEDNILRLKAYDGSTATEHTEMEVGRGVCGAAAKTGTTEIIPDVSKDQRYLQCFINTKSEIVVPIKDSTHVYGEIDIDSNFLDAFTEADKRFLENIAVLFLRVAKDQKNWGSGLTPSPRDNEY